MTKRSVKKSKTTTGAKGAEGVYKNLIAQFDKVWREAVGATTNSKSKKSHFRYRNSMKNFLWFCAQKFRLQKIANVGEKHLRAYVEYRRREGTSEKTLKNDLSAVRFFHRFTDSRNELPDNRALGLGQTPAGGKDKSWMEEEYRRMLEKAEKLGRTDVVMAMKLARNAGLRVHECTRLTVGHVRDALRDRELEVKGKGGRVRRVPLRPELKLELERFLEERGGTRGEKIFVPPGEKTHRVIKSIQKFIERHREKITDRSITFHGLRHAYAREELSHRLEHPEKYSLQRANPVKAAKLEVAELLGHGRPEVTSVYTGK